MAAVGAGGFIIGFALQEALSNFASGLMIMIYRPLDVDDYVAISGYEGHVKAMSLVSTTLVTLDNKQGPRNKCQESFVRSTQRADSRQMTPDTFFSSDPNLLIIPNKNAFSDTIVNFTGNDTRRVDLVFGISYTDDIRHAIDVLRDVATAHELVLEDPPVGLGVEALADSSVNLFCRPWVKSTNYWDVYWDFHRLVKERFDAEGISIPFPQRDVHMYMERAATG